MLKITLISVVIVTILLTANNVHAKCGLTGAFCGRGLNRVNCCDGYFCDIAPNDAYARCTPNGATTTDCGITGAFCGRGVGSVACCEGFYCDVAPNDAYANCTPI